VPAPDRLLEDVFARTETAPQVRRGPLGRLGRLVPWPWRSGSGGAPGLRRGLALGAAAVVLLLVGANLGPGFGVGPGAAVPTPTVTPASPPPAVGQLPALAVARSHDTCGRRGNLVVLPGTAAVRASVWVTCGADSEEVIIGTDTITRRPGLSTVASDGTADWAIDGDSVVRLAADRSVVETVRIGTPSAIAVGAGATWVLDTRTGRLSSIASGKVVATAVAGDRPVAIAIAAGSLWVLDQAAGQLLRLDVTDGHRIAAIDVNPRATMLVAAAGRLYVASPADEIITRIDPVTGAATTLAPNVGALGHIDALGGSPDRLLLGSRNDVFELDPMTGMLGTGATSPGYVTAIAANGPTILALTDGGLLVEAALP